MNAFLRNMAPRRVAVVARRAGARRLRVAAQRLAEQAHRLQVDVVGARRSRCRPTSRRRATTTATRSTTATGLAAAGANKGTRVGVPAAPTPDAQDRARRQRALAGRQGDARAGVEHDARVLERERASCSRSSSPQLGIMETDWAENRAEIPQRLPRGARSASTSTSSTRRTSATSSARASSAAPSPARSRSTSRIAAMEQVPTGKIDNSSPAAFAWARDAAQSRRSKPRC